MQATLLDRLCEERVVDGLPKPWSEARMKLHRGIDNLAGDVIERERHVQQGCNRDAEIASRVQGVIRSKSGVGVVSGPRGRACGHELPLRTFSAISGLTSAISWSFSAISTSSLVN